MVLLSATQARCMCSTVPVSIMCSTAPVSMAACRGVPSLVICPPCCRGAPGTHLQPSHLSGPCSRFQMLPTQAELKHTLLLQGHPGHGCSLASRQGNLCNSTPCRSAQVNTVAAGASWQACAPHQRSQQQSPLGQCMSSAAALSSPSLCSLGQTMSLWSTPSGCPLGPAGRTVHASCRWETTPHNTTTELLAVRLPALPPIMLLNQACSGDRGDGSSTGACLSSSVSQPESGRLMHRARWRTLAKALRKRL